MKVMRIKTIYCKPRTTVIDPKAYKYPYLLRGLDITRANQVWQIDISYIPMAGGFMYLVAIIDVYSRYIVGWDISNSMQASWVVKTLQQAISEYGAPEIINRDQGTQFTSEEYIGRLFLTIKHNMTYLHLPGDGHELFRLCLEFIGFYDSRRGHSSIQGIPPAQRYMQQVA